MPKSVITIVLALSASLALAGSPSAEKVQAYKKILSNVPVLELPAKAASEIAKVKAADQQEAAEAILKAASEIAPASRKAVETAIAKQLKKPNTIATAKGPIVNTRSPNNPPTVIANNPQVSAPTVGGTFPGGGTVPIVDAGSGEVVTRPREYSKPN